ncbi:cytochrome P450 4V2-like [Physella acuta]|uniref:cytochrome P450 4V2-like n=1 Tax=Physella acuta TaxID=109671 RepID=UPI0027DBB056|nr:cytochrome P450 4V2-like [Physella acuta]XP_059172597.1 cytochrome P450 4V2-like [Physella acuta]
MLVVTVVLGLVLLLIFLAYFRPHKRVRYLIDQIPGPKPVPLLGNAHQLCVGHDWYRQLLGFASSYADAGAFRVWLANKPVVGIFKPEFAEVILSSMKHIDKALEYQFLVPWLGTGLLISTGEKWKQRRKMLTPTFHFNILHDFLQVFNKQSRILMKKLNKKSSNQIPFNIFQDFALCALDIITETAMGKTMEAQSTDSDYVYAVYRMSTLADLRMRKPWWGNDFIYNTFGPGKEQANKLKILHDFTNSVIADRLKDFDQKKAELIGQELSGLNSDPGQRKRVRLAFLDMLLYMSENLTKLSMEDIREEVDTFMFEGHDTTAAAMNWATYLIGSHPDVQVKVHEEIDRVFGDDDRDATMEDLKQLKYLECCIKEALRLFPSVPVFARHIGEDRQIGDYTIPKNTTCVVVTIAIHRNPKIYPDPEQFKPERFLLEQYKNRHPYSYIPFSAGPRNCIGQKFAQLEEKTVLSHLFRNFSVKSTQSRAEIRPVGDLILRPESGVFVELTPRANRN